MHAIIINLAFIDCTKMPPRIALQWKPFSSLLLLPTSIRCSLAPQLLRQATQRRSIRSILKPPPKPSRFDISAGKIPKALSKSSAFKRKEYTIPHRTGVLAVKKGMTSIYNPETAERVGCTILQLDRCQVVGHKRRDKHGYWAVKIGHGWRHPSNCTRPELGIFAQAGVAPKECVVEFRVRNEEGLLPVGALLGPSWFKEGQFVDARSKSRGHGFTGGMKRWGWAGQPASHGQSLTHRTMGSSGGSQGSGSRVHPGKKMPGRMGNEFVTVQNLKVMKLDEANGLVIVKGLVAGPKGRLVRLRDAKKMPWQKMDLDLPTAMPEMMVPAAKEEVTVLA